ncbi:MAG: hypothetical protein U5K79_25290 [Cyclobacteriaceae bacterium]|nr:hypothetical protein [Cyclobacteriaceae bacterium]
MRFLRIGTMLIFSIGYFPSILHAQQVFSKTEFGYKGIFQPYDLPAMLSAGGRDFIMLRQFNRNTMELCRYDQYLFEVWKKKITFDEGKSVPQIFMKGDSIMLLSARTTADTCELEIRIHNSRNGDFLKRLNAEFSRFPLGNLPPDIVLSNNHSKLMVFNHSSSPDSAMTAFTVINLNGNLASELITLPEPAINPSTSNARITDKGDIFYAAADNETRRMYTCFRSSRTGEWTIITADFPFDDSDVSEISIQPLGATSWIVAYSAKSGNRLTGLGALAVNVILKSVIYNEVIRFTEREVDELYSDKVVINSKAEKSAENPYAAMDDFYLTQTFRTPENSVIAIFEKQEVPTQFHKGISLAPLSWDFTINEDNAVTSGDILIYCLSDLGETLWKKVILKRQEVYGTNLGLSYISALYGSNLSLMGHTGRDFFALTLKTTDGSVTRSLDLLPGKDYHFTKRYSCWLDGYSVVLCGISPPNDGLRKLMLVEF